jgi:hypothetical protein
MSKVYIDLEDIVKYTEEIKPTFAPLHRAVIDSVVYGISNNVPAVEGYKLAKWIPASTKPGVHAGMKCSLCKARISYREHFNGQHLYCHRCGAKMIKENEDE